MAVTSLPVLRGMGYAPEGREIFPELTVAENMMVSRRRGHQGTGVAVFPELRELLRRQGTRRDV